MSLTMCPLADFDRRDRDEDNRIAAVDKAREHLHSLLVDAVRKGRDDILPRPGSRFATTFATSTYLTEGGSEQRELLFKACHLALQVKPNAEAVQAALLAFVDLCASDYAEDFCEDMVGGEA